MKRKIINNRVLFAKHWKTRHEFVDSSFLFGKDRSGWICIS